MFEYDEPDDESNDLPTGYCSSCGEECFGIYVDNGIGVTEFWGTISTHHDYQIESNCCNGQVLEHSPKCVGCGKWEDEDEDLCLNCLNLKYPEAA